MAHYVGIATTRLTATASRHGVQSTSPCTTVNQASGCSAQRRHARAHRVELVAGREAARERLLGEPGGR